VGTRPDHNSLDAREPESESPERKAMGLLLKVLRTPLPGSTLSPVKLRNLRDDRGAVSRHTHLLWNERFDVFRKWQGLQAFVSVDERGEGR